MAQFARAFGSRGFPDGRDAGDASLLMGSINWTRLELSERRRAHSVDYAGFEVEEIRARFVHAAGGPVAKHVDEVELRVVVAAVLAVAPDAVFVAQNLLNRGAHMVTALARQYMKNLAHRTGPPACEGTRRAIASSMSPQASPRQGST